MKHIKQFSLLSCLLLLFCINTQQLFSNPGEYFVPTDLFPPNGRYLSTPGVLMSFPNGVVLRNFVNRDLYLTGTLPPLLGSQPYSFTTVFDCELSTDGGLTYVYATAASVNNTALLTHISDLGDTRFFSNQIVQMDISGGGFPAGLMIRESPTRASMGEHNVRTVEGGYQIESFFDVYTEVTLDGGANWRPSTNSTRMSFFYPPENIFFNDLYFPPKGKYISKSSDWDALFAPGVILRHVALKQPSASFVPPPPGFVNVINFNGVASFELSIDGGLTWIPVSPSTSDAVQISHGLLGAPVDFYQTEMLSLNIPWIGGGPGGLPPNVMFRESPTKASLGKLNIRQNNEDGTYRISSFFDIFLELSMDGGQTWWPTLGPPMYLELSHPVEVDTFLNTKAHVVIQPPAGPPEAVQMSGPTIVYTEIPPEGTATDSDLDGLDQVPTEILSMDLTGMSSFGPVELHRDLRHRTSGEIEENVNNTPGVLDLPPFTLTGNAQSFFDVFFQIDILGMPPMFGMLPAHMVTVITHKPPAAGETYEMIGQPIMLVDAQGIPTGVMLITASHTPVPFSNISGYKWDDMDNNNAWDPSEPPLSGWTINLSGPVTASTVTNDTGWYQFTNLPPGNYTVSENGQTDWTQTYPTSASHSINLVAGVDVVGGKVKTEVPNFGNYLSLPCPLWTQKYDVKLEGMGFKIPTDAKLMTRNLAIYENGDVYVCGYGDGRSTKNDYVTIKYDMNGTVKWAAAWNNTAVNKDDKAYALILDKHGNVYVTGESDFGGSKADIITIKYDATGTLQWVKRWNGNYNGRDAGYAIALSPDEALVYVTGETDGGKSKKADYVTVVYDAIGLEYWSTTYNGPSSKIDKAYAIAVDPNSGDVVVTGESDGAKADYATVGYDPTLHTQKWVARYDASGKTDYAFAVKIDASGNVYVTGASDSLITKFDYATVKYTSAGAFVWDKRYNAANKKDYAYDLALDNNGNIYVTGASEGAKTGLDYATLKYDPAGTMVWSAVNRYEGKKKDIARSIVVCDAGDKVFVTGSSDQGTGRKLDYLTLKIDATTGIKDPSWPGRYNGTGLADDIAYSVAVRPKDCCLILTGTSFGGATPKLDLVTIQGSSGSPVPGPITSPPIYNGEDDDEIPTVYALEQNYPNPFNPITTIRIALPEQAFVTLKIYNVLGQEVMTLLDNEMLDAGRQDVELNASDLASGIYFYRITAQGMDENGISTSNFHSVKKMLLLK